jgi:hypothetical protein
VPPSTRYRNTYTSRRPCRSRALLTPPTHRRPRRSQVARRPTAAGSARIAEAIHAARSGAAAIADRCHSPRPHTRSRPRRAARDPAPRATEHVRRSPTPHPGKPRATTAHHPRRLNCHPVANRHTARPDTTRPACLMQRDADRQRRPPGGALPDRIDPPRIPVTDGDPHHHVCPGPTAIPYEIRPDKLDLPHVRSYVGDRADPGGQGQLGCPGGIGHASEIDSASCLERSST